MNRFFDGLDVLHRATLNLKSTPEAFQCQHCRRTDQFVSHGFVYKKQVHGEPVAVGKRLLCTNRHSRQGCGSTLRLSLIDVLPDRHYRAAAWQAFIALLIAGATIAAAYGQATGAQDARHAYRWLRRLIDRLSAYRSVLGVDQQDAAPFAVRCRRLRLLLPTLAALRERDGQALVSHWQRHRQQPFLG